MSKSLLKPPLPQTCRGKVKKVLWEPRECWSPVNAGAPQEGLSGSYFENMVVK